MFTYHDMDAPLADFGPFASIVEIWQGKRVGGCLPGWRDFSAADFLGWHTFLGVSEAVETRDDIRFRFFGAGAVALQGQDFTGQIMSEVLPVAYDKLYREHIVRMLADPFIATAKTPAATDDVKPYFLDIAHLPLADDGRRVDRLLHVLQREGDEPPR